MSKCGTPAVRGDRRGVHLIHTAVGEGHRRPAHVLDGDHANERDEVRPGHIGVRVLDGLEARNRRRQARVSTTRQGPHDRSTTDWCVVVMGGEDCTTEVMSAGKPEGETLGSRWGGRSRGGRMRNTDVLTAIAMWLLPVQAL